MLQIRKIKQITNMSFFFKIWGAEKNTNFEKHLPINKAYFDFKSGFGSQYIYIYIQSYPIHLHPNTNKSLPAYRNLYSHKKCINT